MKKPDFPRKIRHGSDNKLTGQQKCMASFCTVTKASTRPILRGKATGQISLVTPTILELVRTTS